MLVRKDKSKVMKLFKSGEVDVLETYVPNISDRVMEYADKELNLDKIIDESIEIKTHTDGMSPTIFFYALLSAKLKRLFSISDATVAITSTELIDKFELNIATSEEFTCESNMRKFITKVGIAEAVTQEKIEERKKSLSNKSKKLTEQLDEDKIKNELQIRENGHRFVSFFNRVMNKLIKATEKPKIHILDCVKMPVNVKNTRYELSTVINYDGKPMRGYKMGVLRGVTDTGGIIEHLIDGTIADSDIKLVEDEVVNYEGVKKGDYLLMDRGFAKIDFVKELVKKGINVIVPVKKNMDIFRECIKLALESEDDWTRHPNQKRKGQDIKTIKNLKGLWISEKDRNKKPENMMDNAIDFSGCVIRIDKTVSQNKDVIKAAKNAEDETDTVYEDEKYIYLVILSTNTELNASEIIRYYEMRPEIEEDFRQLKDIWKICSFTSTKYTFVMCQICMTFLAYNLFNLFKNSKKGEKYINKSMKKIASEEQRDWVPFTETQYLVITGHYYTVLTGVELLDLYGDCPSKIKDKIKSHLI